MGKRESPFWCRRRQRANAQRPAHRIQRGGNTAALVTPDGIEVPRHLDDNGNMIIPTLAEIEEMKANGEGEWVELPEPSDPPSPQLTEEAWKMQEALRQLEDAARQQQ